nr:ASCH domain-containing protein [Leucobacter weissii]
MPAFEPVPPGELRDRLNDAVLRGTKTATSRLAVMDEMAGTPAEPPGTRVRLLDSNGDAACILEIVGTRVLPFGDVGVDVSAAEGEWLAGLDDWRTAHTRYWTSRLPEIRAYLADEHWDLSWETPVVVRFFRRVGG